MRVVVNNDSFDLRNNVGQHFPFGGTKQDQATTAVVEGNSEKIRSKDHVIWNIIKLSTRISHRIFLISYRRLGWSLHGHVIP